MPSQVDPREDWPGWQHGILGSGSLLEGEPVEMDHGGLAHKTGEMDEVKRRLPPEDKQLSLEV